MLVQLKGLQQKFSLSMWKHILKYYPNFDWFSVCLNHNNGTKANKGKRKVKFNGIQDRTIIRSKISYDL